jgi:hypothetical protein
MVGYQREQMIKYWGFASARCLGLKSTTNIPEKAIASPAKTPAAAMMIMSVRITAPPRLTF